MKRTASCLGYFLLCAAIIAACGETDHVDHVRKMGAKECRMFVKHSQRHPERSGVDCDNGMVTINDTDKLADKYQGPDGPRRLKADHYEHECLDREGFIRMNLGVIYNAWQSDGTKLTVRILPKDCESYRKSSR